MVSNRWTAAPLILAWIAGAGCTTLREVPRSEYAARPERAHARVATRDGLVYDFDYVRVANDTLVGFRERDTPGPVPEVASLAVPLADVDRLSVHGLDWYRTGLVGGGVIAAAVVAGLSRSSNNPPPSSSGGGKPPPD